MREFLRPILRPLWSPVKRSVGRIALLWRTEKHKRAFMDARHAIVDASTGVHVSLTSHAGRVALVYLTIESIARGSVLPAKITLWLNDANLVANPPKQLARLVERGLLVKLAPNYGPHTKYYPEICGDEPSVPLVTADDDILYPETWLSDLLQAHQASPEAIVCHRAHRVSLEMGQLAPYRRWTPCTTTDASILNFATGVSGVLYPVRFLQALRGRGNSFMQKCPKADDVWLHATAVKASIPVKQVRKQPKLFSMSTNHHIAALSDANVANAENDAQIRASYAWSELESLSLELARA